MDDLRIRIDEKTFPALGRAAAQSVIAGLQLDIPAGRFVALSGPSGCGKSTLFNIVAGLDRDWRGTISGLAAHRLGFVFQAPRLLPWRTVEDNVRLVLPEPDGETALLDELFAATGLDAHRQLYANRLSLGLARRVALVRAFAVRPSLLLLDEPFVSLDEPTAQRLRALLRRLLAERPATVLFITHNLNEAVLLADEIVFLAPSPTQVVARHTVTVDRADPAAVAALHTTLSERYLDVAPG